MKIAQNLIALIALLFGLVTVIAGSNVLLGSDPGYIVFLPLLIYNTMMGFVYVGASILIWRRFRQGMYLALSIFMLNLVVLAGIYFLYTQGDSVAIDSLRAMTLRTVVWLVLSAGLVWLTRRSQHSDPRSDT